MQNGGSVTKTSISLDPDLVIRAKKVAAKRGFRHSFSAYLAKLIEDDLASEDAATTAPAILHRTGPSVQSPQGILKPRANSAPKK